MAKITDIHTGADRDGEEELTRAEKRMLAQAGRQAKQGKRRKIRRIAGRVLLTLCTIALCAAAVYVVIHRDEINLDSLVRMISYISLEKDEDGTSEEITYESDDTNCYAQLDDTLLVCSGSRISLFSQSGTAYIEEYVTLDNPTISAAGSYAVVYDLGGTAVYGIAGKRISYTETASGTIMGARINANGWLTLITNETGYKGVVTVYDTGFSASVQVSISSAYVMDALVSDNGKTLAVVTIGADDSTFVTTVTFYDTSTGEVISDSPYTIEGGLAVDLRWYDDGLLLQMNDGIQYLTPEDGVVGAMDDADGYLRGYAFSDEGWQVMIWTTYETGYQGSLIVTDLYGNQLAELSVSQEVYSVSIAGDYIALLYTNELVIYDYNANAEDADDRLTLYDSLTDTAGARQVFMREDGSALLVASETATLFVP